MSRKALDQFPHGIHNRPTGILSFFQRESNVAVEVRFVESID